MIKNIIFDFGDIFINLDKEATAREMVPYGFSALTPELDFVLKGYEMGQMSTAAFLDKMNHLFPSASTAVLTKAWNAILLDFPEERLLFLETLAATANYRLFLLSNTNDLHIKEVQQIMGAAMYQRFKACFEGFYLSHQMGKRKPNANIFEQVLQENGLLASETLFIDDTEENTAAAAKLGIHTWHLLVGQEEVTQLKTRL